MNNLLRLLMKYRFRLIISIAIGLIGFIVYVLYDVGIPTAKGTQLSVSITDGLQGELKFINNAKYPIKISDIDSMIFTTCIFLIEPELQNLNIHFQDDYNKSINKNKLLSIYEAEGLELSGKEEWSRILLSGLTEKRTICAYDLEVSFSYHQLLFGQKLY